MNGWSGPLPSAALLAEWRTLLGEPRPLALAIGCCQVLRLEVCVRLRMSEGSASLPQSLRASFPDEPSERREFAFLCLDSSRSRYVTLPLNLHLPPSCEPIVPTDAFAALEDALTQSDAWKSTHGFPLDVEKMVRFDARQPRWQSVPIVRGCELVLLWAKQESEWQAFAIQPDGRRLVGTVPFVTIPVDDPFAPTKLLDEG